MDVAYVLLINLFLVAQFAFLVQKIHILMLHLVYVNIAQVVETMTKLKINVFVQHHSFIMELIAFNAIYQNISIYQIKPVKVVQRTRFMIQLILDVHFAQLKDRSWMELNAQNVQETLFITVQHLNANIAQVVNFIILKAKHANAHAINFGILLNVFNAIIPNILILLSNYV